MENKKKWAFRPHRAANRRGESYESKRQCRPLASSPDLCEYFSQGIGGRLAAANDAAKVHPYLLSRCN